MIEKLEKILGSGQRANRFKLNFTLPAGVTGSTSDLQVLVKSTSLPGVNVGQIELKRDGKTIRIKGDEVTDATWTATLQIPEKAKDTIKTFYDWKDVVEGYKVKMTADLLDLQNKSSAKFELVGVFLLNLPPLSPDTESSDTILDLEVTFSIDSIKMA